MEDQTADTTNDVTLSPEQIAAESGTHQARVRAIACCLIAGVPFYTEGDPGEAKTTFVELLMRTYCSDHETSLVALHEPPEYCGYPVPKEDEELVDEEGNVVETFPARADQVPVAWVLRLKDSAEKDPGKPVGLFLDELPNGAPATRSAALRGVLEGVWGNTAIPNQSCGAAGNPEHQCESGYRFSAALANRFCHIPWGSLDPYVWLDAYADEFDPSAMDAEYTPDFPAHWRKYESEVRKRLVPFARRRINLFKDTVPEDADAQSGPWPSKRTWTMFSRVAAAALSVGDGWESATMSVLAHGLVGKGAAQEFLAFARNFDLPDPEDWLSDPDNVVIPTRNDKAWAALYGVGEAVVQDMTKQRWRAAWKVFGAAHKQKKAAIAASAVRRLAAAGKKRWGSNVDIVPELAYFKSLLDGMGILTARAAK